MSERYTISTIEECVFLCAHLPDDRRAVFLSELTATIEFAADEVRMAEALGGSPRFKSMVWINDDEKKLTAIYEADAKEPQP
ncbi:hypothetical protein [uncultured Planktomarina sp.]|jgi:hypothetical protein|uniref:hypothetical protein n=1 Tax=uncultured Planktomarina sp. TaxID=1538529 RepID=UPI00325FE07A